MAPPVAGEALKTRVAWATLLRALPAAAALAVIAGLLLPVAPHRSPPDGAFPETRRWALSPQSCTTECQSEQTDCILDCDGNVRCEAGCTEVGRACVDRCRSPAPDAGASN